MCGLVFCSSRRCGGERVGVVYVCETERMVISSAHNLGTAVGMDARRPHFIFLCWGNQTPHVGPLRVSILSPLLV